MRSVCLLFWNQIVTDFVSLEEFVLALSNDGLKLIGLRYKHSPEFGDRFTFLTRWMGVLVEQVFEHCKLVISESFTGASGYSGGVVVVASCVI